VPQSKDRELEALRGATEQTLDKLEGADGWDEISEVTETHIHAAPGAIVNVGDTGKFPAAEVPTTPDNPKPSSVPPIAKGAAHVLREVNSWQKVVGLVVIAVVVIVLVVWRASGWTP
jgi:hypothetical protein